MRKGLMIAAIEDPNPVLFFEHKALYRGVTGMVPNDYYTIQIGKARVVQEGSDISIITYGMGVHWASDYAKAHPNEVKYKKAFPFTEKDYVTAVVFSIAVFCGVDHVLPQVLGGQIETLPGFGSQGSNAFAFNSSKTTTGETFLGINAHRMFVRRLGLGEASEPLQR